VKGLAPFALADSLRRVSVQLVFVANHFVEDDGISASGDRGEEPTRLDRAELLGVADQHELGLGGVGMADQARHVLRADHPGLIDHQDRSLAKAAAPVGLGEVKALEQARDSRCLKTLCSQHIRRPPGRRGDPQLIAGLSPAFGCCDRGEALAGPRLADHDDDSLASREQAADHLALVCLQGGTALDHTSSDQLPGLAARLGLHPLGSLKRFALKLPDPLRGEALALGALGDTDDRIGCEEGVGDSLDLLGRRSVGEKIGDGLHGIAAVEVRSVGGHLAVELLDAELGDQLDL
jgi:hypothetical protein